MTIYSKLKETFIVPKAKNAKGRREFLKIGAKGAVVAGASLLFPSVARAARAAPPNPVETFDLIDRHNNWGIQIFEPLGGPGEDKRKQRSLMVVKDLYTKQTVFYVEGNTKSARIYSLDNVSKADEKARKDYALRQLNECENVNPEARRKPFLNVADLGGERAVALYADENNVHTRVDFFPNGNVYATMKFLDYNFEDDRGAVMPVSLGFDLPHHPAKGYNFTTMVGMLSRELQNLRETGHRGKAAKNRRERTNIGPYATLNPEARVFFAETILLKLWEDIYRAKDRLQRDMGREMTAPWVIKNTLPKEREYLLVDFVGVNGITGMPEAHDYTQPALRGEPQKTRGKEPTRRLLPRLPRLDQMPRF